MAILADGKVIFGEREGGYNEVIERENKTPLLVSWDEEVSQELFVVVTGYIPEDDQTFEIPLPRGAKNTVGGVEFSNSPLT